MVTILNICNLVEVSFFIMEYLDYVHIKEAVIKCFINVNVKILNLKHFSLYSFLNECTTACVAVGLIRT